MIKKNFLSEVIKRNKLCISKNPKGSTRSWPNSYIDLFYESFCYSLLLRKKYPKILEINQSNKLDIKIWESYFEKIKVDQLEYRSIKYVKIDNKNLYDLIIVNDHNGTDLWFDLNKISILLKNEGALIYENIYGQLINILKTYLKNIIKFDMRIYDFRLNRFVVSNCLISIQRKKSFNFVNEIKSIYSLLAFIIMELLIQLLNFLKDKLKK